MRVVLDTGILLAALIKSGTPPDLIYRAWRKKAFELITSEWQLEELRRVSRYPQLRKYLKPAEAGTLVNGLRRQTTVLQELPMVELSPDPDDNPILATAIAGQADYLVTGDKRDLLSLGKVETVQIIAARALTELLGLSTTD
ncbi:MAG: putative toxin-antitoxin system toxin component, PIN family [Gammaproteobacteria bacterium]|nr:putative toxin-antitoxin system toxin component, PIN family [Gammaproteobacteria bacterium]